MINVQLVIPQNNWVFIKRKNARSRRVMHQDRSERGKEGF